MSFRTLKWLLLCMVIVAVGCRKRDKHDPAPDPQRFAPIDVVLKINTDDNQSHLTKTFYKNSFQSSSFQYSVSNQIDPPLTKANADEIINDLNVFLFYRTPAENSKDGKELRRPEFDRHYYFSGLVADIREVTLTDVYIGQYDMLMVANNGFNMCRGTHAHIDRASPDQHTTDSCLQFKNREDVLNAVSDNIDFININRIGGYGLLMKYCDHVVFRKYGQYDESEIVLERVMAKMNLSFKTDVGPGRELKFYDIFLKSLAGTQKIYGQNTIAKSYEDYPIYSDLSTSSSEFTSKEIFFSSNVKGIVESITSEQQRTQKNAPANATYLFMAGKYTEPGEISGFKTTNIGYMIYLWDGNSINDFNIMPNVPYNMSVKFKKPDPNDERLLIITNDDQKFMYDKGGTPTEASGEYMTVGTQMSREIEISGNNMVSNDVTLWALSSENNEKNFTVELYNTATSNWEQILSKNGNISGGKLFDTPTDGDRFNRKIRVIYSQEAENINPGVEVTVRISALNNSMNLEPKTIRVYYKR